MAVEITVPKVRIDIVFLDKNVCVDFEKYFKSKKEVREVKRSDVGPGKFRVVVIAERDYAVQKILPALHKLFEHKAFLIFAWTELGRM